MHHENKIEASALLSDQIPHSGLQVRDKCANKAICAEEENILLAVSRDLTVVNISRGVEEIRKLCEFISKDVIASNERINQRLAEQKKNTKKDNKSRM